MALKIRMSRRGTTNLPFYHIVVADGRAPRDGAYLEKVGSWGDELYEPGDFHHTDLANTLIAEWLASQWINPEPARTNAATGAR